MAHFLLVYIGVVGVGTQLVFLDMNTELPTIFCYVIYVLLCLYVLCDLLVKHYMLLGESPHVGRQR